MEKPTVFSKKNQLIIYNVSDCLNSVEIQRNTIIKYINSFFCKIIKKHNILL